MLVYFSGCEILYHKKYNMTVTKAQKEDIIKKYAPKKWDTGSPEVQVAILTAKIENLKNHLEDHKKDNHSRRGILQMVAKRRKILTYLKSKSISRYEELIGSLWIRK